MELARVTGNVWATKKDERLNGLKLLIVKILESDEKCVVCDIIGAGEGDTVIVARGGGARIAAGDRNIPTDAAIVGIVDKIVEG